MRMMHREHCLQRGHTGRLSGRRYNRCLVCPQLPTSRMRRPNYRVLAVSKLSFSLRITIIQRDLSHPRWFSLPRNSPHLMPGNVDVQIQNPLCWFRTTQKTHPSSRTPHRIDQDLKITLPIFYCGIWNALPRFTKWIGPLVSLFSRPSFPSWSLKNSYDMVSPGLRVFLHTWLWNKFKEQARARVFKGNHFCSLRNRFL